MLRTLSGNGEWLFPGDRNAAQPMSSNTILKTLERMGYNGRMTGHGFRGLASTILHEKGYDHIELQLAHTPWNAVSAAYNHALYLEPRAKMMQDWADFLEHTLRGGKVIPIRGHVARSPKSSFCSIEPVTFLSESNERSMQVNADAPFRPNLCVTQHNSRRMLSWNRVPTWTSASNSGRSFNIRAESPYVPRVSPNDPGSSKNELEYSPVNADGTYADGSIPTNVSIGPPHSPRHRQSGEYLLCGRSGEYCLCGLRRGKSISDPRCSHDASKPGSDTRKGGHLPGHRGYE